MLGSLKEKVIELFVPCQNGYLGYEEIVEEIKQRVYWYRLSTYLGLYVVTCWQCIVNKKSPPNMHAPLQNYQAGYRVHLDMLGPFCESHQGNKYIYIDDHWPVHSVVGRCKVCCQGIFEYSYVLEYHGVFINIKDNYFHSELFQDFLWTAQSCAGMSPNISTLFEQTC